MSKVKDNADVTSLYSTDANDERLKSDAALLEAEFSNIKTNTLGYDQRLSSLQLGAIDTACMGLARIGSEGEVDLNKLIRSVQAGEVCEANIEATRIELMGSGFHPRLVDQLGIVSKAFLLRCFRMAKKAPARLPSSLKLPGNDPEAYKKLLESDSAVVDFAMPSIRRNVLTHELVYEGGDGKHITLQGNDLNTIHLRIAQEVSGSIPKDRAKDQVLFKASQNLWHPGRDFINECRRKYDLSLEEAKQIVNNIASTYLHNDEKIPNIVLGLWLQAHACNTFDLPNAHAPEYLPILCGDQGCFKSSFLQILFGGLTGERSLTTIVSADPQAFFKDVTLVSTAWMMEFPEIERWLTKQNLNAFKGRVTDPYPEGRRPYDALVTRFKRYAVWAGTTNNPQGVLIDKSSNFDRRFIPIQIPSGQYIETELLEQNLEKLWAAVMVLVEAGIETRPHTLPNNLYGELVDYQSPFLEQSPVEGTLLAYASAVNEFSTADAIRCCFGVAEHEISDNLSQEAKQIFRKHLKMMGFTSKKKRVAGGGIYVYLRDTKLTSQELRNRQADANRGRTNSIRFDSIPVDGQEGIIDF
jgi:hypothetical protein